jgi:hypothetical protein
MIKANAWHTKLTPIKCKGMIRVVFLKNPGKRTFTERMNGKNGFKEELTEFIPSGAFAVDNYPHHNQNDRDYTQNNKHCAVKFGDRKAESRR